MMMTVLCMKHLAVGETIPRRYANVAFLETKPVDGIVESSNNHAALVHLAHFLFLVHLVRWPKETSLTG
jgi:hypothetical protein